MNRTSLGGRSGSARDLLPYRGPTLPPEKLADRARAEAATATDAVVRPRRSSPLAPLIARIRSDLEDQNRFLASAARDGVPISASMEWLLDNHYLIDDQARSAAEDLPAGYGAELPRLTSGPLADHPRIWQAAILLLTHTDSRLGRDEIIGFLCAYQEVAPLTIGETWALPIILRIALADNVRRLSAQVVEGIRADRLAEQWGERILTALEAGPHGGERILSELEASVGRNGIDPPLLARLIRHLRLTGRDVDTAVRRIMRLLVTVDGTFDQLVEAERRRVASNQVSIANSVTSIRHIDATDWRSFFEATSVVERALREDPAGVYPIMDFLSRDRYRRTVERLARRWSLVEADVAKAAVDAASAALLTGAADVVRGHVGWHLISDGRPALEARLHGAAPPKTEAGARHGGSYAALLAVITALIMIGVAVSVGAGGAQPWAVILLAATAMLPVSGMAIDVTNRLVASIWPPRWLPRLDFERPLEEAHRTLVIVTTLLSSTEQGRKAVKGLETRMLANRDPNVHFGLLADLRPAPDQRLASDDAIIGAVREAAASLNAKYGGEQGPFHVFLRERRRDEVDGVWLGWERKRGALTELNRFLRGSTDTSIMHDGDPAFLPGVTFVITLDSDTVLPRDAARSLVATIAHPLNRARVDQVRRSVTRGYGLVQPRLATMLESATATRFSALHAGPTGIDPYASASSDTYQDVFGEGSFTGKGIYEVDVFRLVLDGRVPERTLLSHDLIEGNFLRTALAGDIQLLDEHPADYGTQCSRTSRWTRGDWQTTPWLRSAVPGEDGIPYSNPLSLLHRWKILDNLRRSVQPTSIIVWGLGGWLLRPHPVAWAAVLALLMTYPAFIHALDDVALFLGGTSFRALAGAMWADLGEDLLRSVTNLAFLPHQAHLSLDAIVRAWWRMHVSHRRMLEWTTAAEAQAAAGSGLSSYVMLLGPASLIASLAASAVAMTVPQASPWLLPVILLWLSSPVIAWSLSRPSREPGAARPSAVERAILRRISRRTWRFFETFVSPEDNWLPPDNYQEDPNDVVAHRTSPTNMGLALMANITAHDLGYLSLSGVVERVSRTMETMMSLERFRGHFFNWYDTVTRRPLHPAYVSTVDSGNLAGSLIALRQGLDEALAGPLVGPQALDGIADGALIALEDLRDSGAPDEVAGMVRFELGQVMRRAELAERPTSLPGWHATLMELDRSLMSLIERVREVSVGSSSSRVVAEAARCVRGHLIDVEMLAPWAVEAATLPQAVDRRSLAPLLDAIPSLRDLASGLEQPSMVLRALAHDPDPELSDWASRMTEGLAAGEIAARDLIERAEVLRKTASDLWDETDLRLVYDESRGLFSIGFNTEQGRCDDSFYDMLASECRLTSYLAVARGDVRLEHWFRLNRQFTRVDGNYALLSWSASMFEYLMPLMLMRSWRGTLLDRTYTAIVRRQIEYGAERRVPWGVSESAFNSKDAELTYQYQAFGVPGLGLKRGLSEDIVVAPYATMLAAQVDRPAALRNLEHLAADGAMGVYGFYEAIDYTPGRVEKGRRRTLVKTYMAHHQGMSLISLGNELTGHAMSRRFHSDPLVASAELLLQERVPRLVQPAQPHVEEVEFVRARRDLPPAVNRSYPLADTPSPATHFLSNGRYSVMITNAGGGYSRWLELGVTRYREDITRDSWGQFIVIRDVDSGRIWSAAHQPTCTPADEYHCTLSADRADFRRRDGEMETHTEVTVSQEDDVEIRRLAITNHGRAAVQLEVTSYFEITLAPQPSDQAHRAFSNLFVETEWLPDTGTVLFTRRPRSDEEPRRWGLHTLACDAMDTCEVSVETDRSRFVGRMRQVRDAAAFESIGPLSGTVGAVLDPICSIRRRITVPSGESVRLAFNTGVAETREGAIGLAEKYRDIRSAQRAIDLAWGTAEVEMRDLGVAPEDAVVYQRLASRLLLTDPYSPLKRGVGRENKLPMSALWGLGISGDLPILLVHIDRLEDTTFVRQCLLAHQYWRHQGFRCDLVILNDRPSGYTSELGSRLHMLVRTGQALQMLDKPGGVFLRQSDQIAPEVHGLLESVARATLDADAGPLLNQIDRHHARPEVPAALVPRGVTRTPAAPATPVRPLLDRDNGYGGIDPATGEYVIVLANGDATPAPWINVISSPDFGTMVSEAGIGCTWALNSHENRLTTWNNDPVSDGSGELLYVRDEETGEIWSPTPLPVRDEGVHIVRHGRGYSTFSHETHGVDHQLSWFVPLTDPVRIASLTLTNRGTERRSLSVTHFVEWVLGDSRSKASQRVTTAYDTTGRMLTATSPFNEDFPNRLAFLASDKRVASYTADRTEFIGRNGSVARPAALGRVGLGGLTGRFHDTCGALMTMVALDPGESVTVRFFLGQTDGLDEARRLVARYREPDASDAALDQVREQWAGILDTLTVSTPDEMFDAMANGRALYQALACRVWGRTALYQNSGAFGFRDQLQDVMALTLSRPDIARAQIVEASRRQFPEGDVLHWWQPFSGRGVRTHFRDDRLWLPFVTADYLETTGDGSVLEERTPFVDGPPVPEGREDLYLAPAVTTTMATVYDHCVRAIEATREVGVHGLPLIGGGDWNDGMNRVGAEGRGESVWLAWFLIATLRRFAPICASRGESAREADYLSWADRLAEAVEREAWDGAWYRRAYFDDGTPLGTREAEECRIDAIAQAWAVISGAGDRHRARVALDSVEEKLVRREHGLLALLAPPFDRMEHDPGYIKGYVPGVRENGGQYTHAALWVVMAYAMLGDGDEALDILDLINPLSHATTREEADAYRVEPYVIAADVYAVDPHAGRGGWTWYTGSASWFHNVSVRSILGITTVGAPDGIRRLVVDPTIPKSWPGYSATLRLGGTTWRITVKNPRGTNHGVERVSTDGEPMADRMVPLVDDGGDHEVIVTMIGG